MPELSKDYIRVIADRAEAKSRVPPTFIQPKPLRPSFWMRFLYWCSVMADMSEMPIAADKQHEREERYGFRLTDADAKGDLAALVALMVPFGLVGAVGLCLFMLIR